MKWVRPKAYMKKYILSTGFAFAAFSAVFGQAPKPTPPAGEEVVRITTNLIQIDVTVTDKDGQVVPGLTADDFELFENGQRQNVSGVTFISRSVGWAAANAQYSVSAEKSTDGVVPKPAGPTGPTSPVSAPKTRPSPSGRRSPRPAAAATRCSRSS